MGTMASKALPYALMGLGGASALKNLFGKGPSAPTLSTAPAAPDPAVASAEQLQAAAVATKRRQQLATSLGTSGSGTTARPTLLTGPLGLTQPAPTATKTLLGS